MEHFNSTSSDLLTSSTATNRSPQHNPLLMGIGGSCLKIFQSQFVNTFLDISHLHTEGHDCVYVVTAHFTPEQENNSYFKTHSLWIILTFPRTVK
jgi:hypothetical protein